MLRLKNITVLVTGAGRGEAIAKLFAEESAIVIVTDINDESGKEVAVEIGESSFYHHLDVRKEEDWIAAIKLVEKKLWWPGYCGE